MRLFKIIITLFFIYPLYSCYKNRNPNDDFFYLQNKNVYLPVWVKGNLNSSQILLVIHGGPGGNDNIYMNLSSFQQLEKNYTIVYYDQRASGASQSSAVINYSANDHIQDLEKLVYLIKEKYGKDKQLILLGHSWGGMLGSLFLEKGRNRNVIQGWINVDGSYQTIETEEYKGLVNTANAQIQAGNSLHFWKKTLSELNKMDINHLSIMDLSKINNLGYKGETVLQDDQVISNSQGFDAYNFYFNSSYHPTIYALNELYLNTLMFQQSYKENLSILPLIDDLTTPTCLLWGRHDLIVSPTTLNILKEKMKNVIYDYNFVNSGHSPMITEPEEFTRQIDFCAKSFLEL